jgi:hypothetical protein
MLHVMNVWRTGYIIILLLNLSTGSSWVVKSLLCCFSSKETFLSASWGGEMNTAEEDEFLPRHDTEHRF